MMHVLSLLGGFIADEGGGCWAFGGGYLLAILVEAQLAPKKVACSCAVEIAAGRFSQRADSALVDAVA